MRAAIDAKADLDGCRVNDRPISLHWSIPKAAELSRRGKCEKGKNHATLFLELMGPQAREATIRDLEEVFCGFGSIRHITRPQDKTAFVQFWDSRDGEKSTFIY